MTDETAGSCLCGNVGFSVAGEFANFFLCHCSRCRKGTGSAHAANLFSPGAELTWLRGKEYVKTYRVPGTRHEKSFCSECGSALPARHLNRALVVVPAGSLDTPLTIRPDAHICCSDRADWDTRLEDIPQLGGLPGQPG